MESHRLGDTSPPRQFLEPGGDIPRLQQVGDTGRDPLGPGFIIDHGLADIAGAQAFIFIFDPAQDVGGQSQGLEVLQFTFSPGIVDGDQKNGVHGDVVAVAFGEVDGQGNDGKRMGGDPLLQKDAFHQEITLVIRQRIGQGIAAMGVDGLFAHQQGLRVGDAHHQVPAQGLAGQEIFQMVVVQDLEAAVDHTGFILKILMGHGHFLLPERERHAISRPKRLIPGRIPQALELGPVQGIQYHQHQLPAAHLSKRAPGRRDLVVLPHCVTAHARTAEHQGHGFAGMDQRAAAGR